MKKLATVVALLVMASTSFSRTGEAAPIGSNTLWEVTTPDLRSPAVYYGVLQEILELDPGTDGPTRIGQQEYIQTVLEGELSIVLGDKRSIYRKGQAAVIPPGISWWFGNEGDTRLRIHETIVQPAWQVGPAKVIKPAANSGRVTTPLTPGSAFINHAPTIVNLTQQGAELNPGYASSHLAANAFNILTVVSGEVTLRYGDGTTKRLVANQVGSLELGKAVVLANEGSGKATYIMSWLSEPGSALNGAALSVSLAPASPTTFRPPATGDAGLAAS